MTDNGQAAAAGRDTPQLLRDLAWTIHRRIPDPAGLEPLPMTELAVLKHVLDAPGITVTELSRQLGLRQSNASAAVRTLAERGLVARESGATDRRVSHVAPTSTALAADSAIAAAWAGGIRGAMAELPPEHRRAIEAAAPALQALDGLLRR